MITVHHMQATSHYQSNDDIASRIKYKTNLFVDC